MSIELIVTTERINEDPIGRGFVDYIQKNAAKIGIEESVVYYDFPVFSDYESVLHKPDILILSKTSGIIPIKIIPSTSLFTDFDTLIESIDESLDQFSGVLASRLLKSKLLRADRATLKLSINPIIYGIPLERTQGIEVGSAFASSYDGFASLVTKTFQSDEIEETVFDEARSVIEGAKALSRPTKRIIANPEVQKHAAAYALLENEIANFDAKQRKSALSLIQGPQRIRGLAGSGKTIILAMKAAHIHMSHPEARILVTYYTKSLRTLLKRTITKFYRHYKDEDPDWNKLHIFHGWGSGAIPGVYSETCKRHNVMPLTFAEANSKSRELRLNDPFGYACQDLADKVRIKEYYDYILIDEGQDFPSSFYTLAYQLSKGTRDKKNIIWAYDELQNILNVKIRTPEDLFGQDIDQKPRISLTRSGVSLPSGVLNDIVLEKCYRNQREVLMIAHALGLGIYGDIVQMLENKAHWEDVGYKVISGELEKNKAVDVTRPEENSPLSLDKEAGNVIEYKLCKDFDEEIKIVTTQICTFLQGGLRPEEILVVALDDRNARSYFTKISSVLAELGIETNNILAPYTEPPFIIENKITLSTVYRAKGNEAAVVFAVGVDGVDRRTRGGRNKLFTSFTRTKGWLRVTGVGENAKGFMVEMDKAMKDFPHFKFIMPDLTKVETIQRGLSEKGAKLKKAREEYVKKLRAIGMTEEEIAEELANPSGDSFSGTKKV